MLSQEVAKAEGGSEGDQDGFGGVLRQRRRAADADEPQSQAASDAEATQKVLDDYFGADEAQLGEGDRFLKKFIANKAGLHPMLPGNCCVDYPGLLPCIRKADTLHLSNHIPLVPLAVQMTETAQNAMTHQAGPLSGHSWGATSRLASLQGWLDQEDGGRQGYGTDDEEDEEYIERAERFESAYNHRFEARAFP